MVDGARWDSEYHAPVLAAETVRLLAGGATEVRRDVAPTPPPSSPAGTLALDGTLGGGGHSLALLEAGFQVTGVDRDPAAIAVATRRLEPFAARGLFQAVLANYADLDDVPLLAASRFAAIVLDLGISSRQVDDVARGFSFRQGAPLDMRMGDDAALDAAAYLNETEPAELMRVFREYADEPRASRLAREVVRRRATRPFAVSDDLVGAIRGALGARAGASDFARLFQSVRIAVNDELAGLERALPSLRDRLLPAGRFAVISYHSGEDRIVKHAFREWSVDCECPPRQPTCNCGRTALGTVITRRAVTADAAEVARNARARSARLRVWQRAA